MTQIDVHYDPGKTQEIKPKLRSILERIANEELGNWLIYAIMVGGSAVVLYSWAWGRLIVWIVMLFTFGAVFALALYALWLKVVIRHDKL